MRLAVDAVPCASLALLLAVCVFSAALAVRVGRADAAVQHPFLKSATENMKLGVPSGDSVFAGPLSGVSALSARGGRVWVAERLESGEFLGSSRVDAFDGTTGEFAPPQLDEEAGLTGLYGAVAVGGFGVSERVYVAAGREGKNVVAVFNAGSGALEPEGVWDGAATPSKAFSTITGLAISENLGTEGDAYVPTYQRGEPENDRCSSSAVNVFGPGGAAAEPPLISRLTGTTIKKEGKEEVPFSDVRGVAVSPTTGDLVVSDSGEKCTEVLNQKGEPANKKHIEPGENQVDVFTPVPGSPGTYAFGFVLTAPHGVFERLGPVAVDGSGDIYVADLGRGEVDQFDQAGSYLGAITGAGGGKSFSSMQSLSADTSTSDIYIGDYNPITHAGVVDVFGPTLVVPDAITSPATAVEAGADGLVSATLDGSVNPLEEGPATCRFAWGTTPTLGRVAPCTAEVPNGSTSVPVSAPLNGLQPDTTYFYRLQASNHNGTNAGEAAGDREFTTPGPGIHSESVSEVSDESATLNATIDPHGAPTSYHFEYGRTASYEASTPAAPGASIGEGNGDVTVTPRHITGLVAGTVYHYRAVAVSEVEVGHVLRVVSFPGPDQTFVTQRQGAGQVLADGRHWELVSPVDKHGALLEPITQAGIAQAAAGGGAVSYVASLPTEASVKGYVYNGEQVMSERIGGLWRSQDLSVAHATASGLPAAIGKEYRQFTPDLSSALIEPLGEFSSLAPEVFPPDTERTAYLRHDSTCVAAPGACFEPILTGASGYRDVPEGAVFGGDPSLHSEEDVFRGEAPVVGASGDLQHVVVRSRVDLAGSSSGGKAELYEWSAGAEPMQRLQLISTLPGASAGVPSPSSADLGNSSEVARNAVSEDGSRVVWSDSAHLYLHDLSRDATMQLDLPEESCMASKTCGDGTPAARFQAASTDDSRVLFTDTQPLTRGAGGAGGANLYECQVKEDVCALTDLTPSSGPESAVDVLGNIIGTSGNGSWVYFVANGVLGDGAERGATTSRCLVVDAIGSGSCNLYVEYDGAVRFIATLAGGDFPDWGEANGLQTLTARVSGNGEWLAFMSERPLTGYDNRDAASGVPDEEVYLYHAEASGPGSVVCTSCDPSGARPTGVEYGKLDEQLVGGFHVFGAGTWIAANIPGWTPYELSRATYQSRVLSDQGRVFFNSKDSLVAGDSNHNQDVYEFEPVGIGSCSEAAASFIMQSHGCVSLISSGRASGESAFLDASESGDDVFFLSSGRLVPQDSDSALDVYDAHVCSASVPCPSEVQAPAVCATADACRSASSPQPALFGEPASATFAGVGNLIPIAPAVAVKPKAKPKTRKQKLETALKRCKKLKKTAKRKSCEAAAHKRLGVRARSKIKSKSRDGGK